jgi:hypothetical protein
MSHPTQEDLVSYLYFDHEDAASLEAHLDGCSSCREEVALLRRVLAEVSAADDVPERPADYGERVWRRVAAGLPAHSGWRARMPLRPSVLLAAAAVVILATFLAGRFSGRWGSSASDVEGERQERAGKVPERVLLVALSDHVEESQVLLLELANRGQGIAASPLDREKAEELLRASRLYRQSAYRLGDAATADVLEDLERLLLDVSHAPESGEGQKSIQDRIRDRDMLFKLRVLDASVKSREQKLATRKF